MSGPQGDRYQHLYSWYELLPLLAPDSPYEHGYVEHPAAGAADDVTLHPRPGSSRAARFMQIKWHVDQRAAYSFDNLIEVIKGARSLLEKLFDSWKSLRAQGEVEIWLVSNWSVDGELDKHLDGRGHALEDSFFAEAGKALRQGRAKWRKQLGATPAELDAFCRALRLRLGFGSISDLEDMVDDRMQRHGLAAGDSARANAIDLVSEWIEVGGRKKRVTAASLREAIAERALAACREDEPGARLWIHGWAKRTYEGAPTVELDFTAYFDHQARRVPPPGEWPALLAELAAAERTIAQLPRGHFVDVRGQMPLCVALAAGRTFSRGRQYRLRIQQLTPGAPAALWDSNVPASARRFMIVHEEEHAGGEDLALALSVTADAKPALDRFLAAQATPFRRVAILECDGGPGGNSIGSDHDAVALAASAHALLRELRHRHGLLARTHLFLVAPAGFALFLGQELNAVGEIVNYERAAGDSYQAALMLTTG